MKTYLEIQVPIKFDLIWFKALRKSVAEIPVKWQNGYYHITMAFIDETPEDVELRPILEKHLSKMVAPKMTFNKLDAFTTRSGMHIIYMTAMNIPEEFLQQTEAIRTDLKAAGCLIQSDFMLHVTLGRVKAPNLSLEAIKQKVNKVYFQPFSMTLTNANFREFRGKMLFETKLSSGVPHCETGKA